MPDSVLYCEGRDDARCACCPANDAAQPDVCWLKAPLSTMTAAELVERLARFAKVTATMIPPIPGIASGNCHVALERDSGVPRYIVVHAPTLSAALEEALRKAEGNE